MGFSKETRQLLDQLNQIYPGSIVLRTTGTKTNMILPEHVTTDALGSRLMIEVNDLTAPDFEATREMLKMMLTLNGYPQVYFQLRTKEEKIDEQLMIMMTYLYQPALNAIIYREQAKHGQLTNEVVKAYINGVLNTLTPEDGKQDEAALRLLTLIDTKVFLSAVSEDVDEINNELKSKFPESFAAAELLFDQMIVEKIKDPFTVGQAIQTLFKGFDAQMLAWDLPEIHAQEFATVTPVLSAEQLEQPVSSNYGIRHVDFNQFGDDNNKNAVFIGEDKTSGQNSFILKAPGTNTAEFFKELYALPTKELFEQLKQPYTAY